MTPLTRTAFIVSRILHPAVLLVVAIFLFGVMTQSSLGLAFLFAIRTANQARRRLRKP